MLQFFQKHRSRQRAMEADTSINAKVDWSLGTDFERPRTSAAISNVAIDRLVRGGGR